MTWSQQEWVKRTHKEAGLLAPNILYATTHGCDQRKVPQNDGGDGGFLRLKILCNCDNWIQQLKFTL